MRGEAPSIFALVARVLRQESDGTIPPPPRDENDNPVDLNGLTDANVAAYERSFVSPEAQLLRSACIGLINMLKCRRFHTNDITELTQLLVESAPELVKSLIHLAADPAVYTWQVAYAAGFMLVMLSSTDSPVVADRLVELGLIYFASKSVPADTPPGPTNIFARRGHSLPSRSKQTSCGDYCD